MLPGGRDGSLGKKQSRYCLIMEVEVGVGVASAKWESESAIFTFLDVYIKRRSWLGCSALLCLVWSDGMGWDGVHFACTASFFEGWGFAVFIFSLRRYHPHTGMTGKMNGWMRGRPDIFACSHLSG